MDDLLAIKNIIEEASKISWVFCVETLQFLYEHSETKTDKAIYLTAIGMSNAVTQSQKRNTDSMLQIHKRNKHYANIDF